jgi:acetolactate synthase-1/2/3 large subunit
MGIGNILSSDPLFAGRPGAYGDRASHFAVQQCDLLFILGCRLSVSTVGYYPDRFGFRAKKVQVDVDAKELAKNDVPVDYKIRNTVGAFVDAVRDLPPARDGDWIRHCADMRAKYPVVLEEYRHRSPLNAYYFTRILSDLAPENTVITVDTGSVCNIVSQTWDIKAGQRFLFPAAFPAWGSGRGPSAARRVRQSPSRGTAPPR